MKKTILVLAAIVVTSFAKAQQITIDPEVGSNFGKIRNKIGDNTASSDDNNTGVRVGAGVSFGLSHGLYLKPGFYYAKKGSQRNTPAGDFKTDLHYLEMPLNLGYQYKINGGKAGGVFAEAGPYLGYAVSGRYKGENLPVIGTSKTDIEFGSGTTETRAFDWGFHFGLGYLTPWGVYLRTQYGLGLGNLSNVDNVTSNNRGWNLSIGYRIAL